LKANKVNLFVSSVLFDFWYNSPNFLDTPHICDTSRLTVNKLLNLNCLILHVTSCHVSSGILKRTQPKNNPVLWYDAV
jgi:hypothetical protein